MQLFHDKPRFAPLTVLIPLLIAIFLLGCSSRTNLVRQNPIGPLFESKTMIVFLDAALDTVRQEGAISIQLAHDMRLSNQMVLPKETRLTGFYVLDHDQVLFAPAFAIITNDDGSEQTIAINSQQTGRVAVTPLTANQMRDAGMEGAIGQHAGDLSGRLHDRQMEGNAINQATWLNGRSSFRLPAGSSLVLDFR